MKKFHCKYIMRSKKILIIIFLFLLLSACQKDYVVSEDQKIFFQTSYVNFAWGTVNRGYLIDNNGNILSYSNPVNWNYPDEAMELSAADINENLSKCVPTGKKISSGELQKYINYIDNLASGKMSASVNRGADMGSASKYCFQYSPATSTYKCITIKIEGDWESKNLNYFSDKVSNWLFDVTRGL
jgi:hypothetical protein